jgi:hypothetical protein
MLIKISIIAVAALLFLLSVFRPETDFSEKLLPNEKGRDAISEMGDISKSKPVGALSPAKEAGIDVKKNVKEEEKVLDTPEKKFEKANANITDSYKKHGDNVALKAMDKLNEKEKKHSGYHVVEPDFSSPQLITYKGLKKVYTYFRLKESLPMEVVDKLNGAAIVMTGAVMPVDKIPEDGVFRVFWLSNPSIVLAGCVFCNPPTLADIIYVYKDRGENPFKFEREKLLKQVVLVRVTGRLFFGPEIRNNQIFLFSVLANDVEILN